MRARAASARARQPVRLIFPTSITDKKILHQPSPLLIVFAQCFLRTCDLFLRTHLRFQ
jgi:hypothetical protein